MVESQKTVNAILYPELVNCVGRREEVLRGMWAGKGMKEIGADLRISPKTVEYHRAQLYRLFGVHDPVSLCRRGLVAGVLEVDGKLTKAERN